jgi:hypothetical protein
MSISMPSPFARAAVPESESRRDLRHAGPADGASEKSCALPASIDLRAEYHAKLDASARQRFPLRPV